MTGIKAVAEAIRAHVPSRKQSRCNVSVCGMTRLGEQTRSEIYVGMIPLQNDHPPTVALTELPGGPADPRQRYDTAYDNPSYTLHILGGDLVELDTIAESVRRGADRTSHIETEFGTINTLAVGPARRVVRSDHPRYDVQLEIRAEFIRVEDQKPSVCNLAICGYTRLGSGRL